MEENFGSQKPFVADFDVEVLLGDGVGAGVLLDVLVGVLVKLAELLCNVRTDVTVAANKMLQSNNHRPMQLDGEKKGGNLFWLILCTLSSGYPKLHS